MRFGINSYYIRPELLNKCFVSIFVLNPTMFCEHKPYEMMPDARSMASILYTSFNNITGQYQLLFYDLSMPCVSVLLGMNTRIKFACKLQ